jgi:hypothetical protein
MTMKYFFRISVFLFLIYVPVSCYHGWRTNFDMGIIPHTPVNFTIVNSGYDDYNSAEPPEIVWHHFSLFFSTNRNSNGDDFDFVYYQCYLESNLMNGEFRISAYQSESSLTESVNDQYNELGPYFTRDFEYGFNIIQVQTENRFFYSSDINGNYDLFCLYYSDDYNYTPEASPFSLEGLNTEFDEGYLTIHQEENPGRETVYFTSDRDGTFDIYCALSEEKKLIDQSEAPEVFKVVQLSSDAEDKCPFIANDILIFVSDRHGGFGGYDLWYSVYKDREWSTPENFGEDINTEYDEYRPIILVTNPDEYLNNLMIFSSNRPGGKGGFDLYYVGVNKMINFTNQ